MRLRYVQDQKEAALAPYAIAIVGGGALARERDLRALSAIADFNVVGVARHLDDKRIEATDFDSLVERDAGWPALDAVAICTPPGSRYKLARAALGAGMHVSFDGQPTHILGEISELAAFAHEQGKTVYTAWPLQNAPAVIEAKSRLSNARVRLLSVYLDEDMTEWRRRRGWSLKSPTLGIFDSGVHVLSALTKILPDHVLVDSAFLGYIRDGEASQYPRQLAAPSSAFLTLKVAALQHDHSRMNVEFNWNRAAGRGNGWEIEIETDQNTSVRLTDGGSTLYIDGLKVVESTESGCEMAYRQFSQLIDRGISAIDVSAIELVDAAFSVGVNVAR
jgi:D-galactose 1-dehydrogenase